jgi:hypothetical protein
VERSRIGVIFSVNSARIYAMPSLRCRNGSWRVEFCIDRQRSSKTLGRITEEEARAAADQFVKERLIRYAATGLKMTRPQLGRILKRTEYRAKVRGIDFLLTLDDLEFLFIRSGGMCVVSNIKFDNERKHEDAACRPWAVSIDRIDSSKPYTRDNCRLVCVAVNMALGQWGVKVLKKMATAIVFKGKRPIEA